MADTVLLEVKNLAFCYKNNKKTLFENVSFQLCQGDILALLGPNGAGKSTLLDCLAGFQKPVSGQIFLQGIDVYQMSAQNRARSLAYVSQNVFATCPYTVREYILLGAVVRTGVFSQPAKAEVNAADAIIERLEIQKYAEEICSNLSGGERQMVAIARALMQKAQIILLDEPTAALDIKNQVLILQTIKKLEKEGYGIVFTTHLPDQILLLNAKFGLFYNKKVLFNKTVDGLTENLLETIYQTKLRVFYEKELQRKICIIPDLQ